MRRDFCDFHAVEAGHLVIHARLINWSRWVKPGRGSKPAPMWRWYRSSEHWEGSTVPIPINTLDAVAIQKAVSQLPEPNLRAINWHYVHPSKPRDQAQELGVTLHGLAQLVRAGRGMLINRRA